MPDSDLILDGGNAIIEGNWLVVKCLDLKLDAPSRRSNRAGERRALVHGFNDELVVNYAQDYPGGVNIRGDVVFSGKIKQNHFYFESTDIHLDHPARRTSTSGHRRAIVHGFNDEVVLNYNKDYPGGVTVHGSLEVQKSGALRLRNSNGNVVANLNSSGALVLGGNGSDGDLELLDGDGQTRIHADAGARRIDFRDGGTTSVRVDADDFTGSAWPPWAGEPAPARLDLIAEVRRLKEELLSLKAQVDALTP